MHRSLLIASLGVFACTQPRASEAPESAEESAVVESSESDGDSSNGDRSDAEDAPLTEELPEPTCDEPLPVYVDGESTRSVCEGALGGLTVVDLNDDWAPFLFSEDPALGDVGTQDYRPVYLALADERLSEVDDSLDHELYLELFGITPTFRVLIERLGEDERHACHAQIDDAPIENLSSTLRPWSPTAEEQRERVRTVRYLRARLSRAAEEEGEADLHGLDDHERWGPHYKRLVRLAKTVDAIEAVQAHLVCDGPLGGRARYEEGVFDWRTAGPLATYQRRHLIVSGGALDAPTRRSLQLDSREEDFAAVLRSLRERVIDATGLIEDGSAARQWGDVLRMPLDADEFRFDAGQPPAENPATDHVAPATEAAARALGLTSPEAALAQLRALRARGHGRVAVRLPPPPPYYSAAMALRAEVDRGDVYYRCPYDSRGRRLPARVERRPVLTLYAEHEGQDVALVRWPTTIGGWKPERTASGGTGLKYKLSYVGERVWRDVIAAPAWLPPPSTPGDDLLRRVNGRMVPNYSLFGPGYRSAYGLAMLMHHRVLPPLDPDADPESPEAQPRFFDQGIRVHGSVSYRSMTTGTSHGCHRLFNHLAVRLASFVLRHRTFVRHGQVTVRYRRKVRGHDFRIRSRGYRYELTPPVPVHVLEGRLRGGTRAPISGFRPLREALVRSVEAESAE
ncbi:MAG: hypothetical protein AAF411_00780 [Myxococcota bacterium]